MAQSVIGALRVNLGLDAAQFRNGTRNAQNSMQQLQRRIAVAAAAISAAVVGIGAVALRGAREIDETAKAARRLDASTTGFQALQLAAGEAGVSLSGLTNDVQTLNRELSTQSTGAQRAVEQLGLTFEDFVGLDADERIALIADRVQEMGMSAGQATGVLRDLGIRNREMALAVLQGGEAFRNARRDVEDYGLAISDGLGARMEQANDRIGRLSIVSQLFGRRLAEQLVPALGRLAETITDSVREGGRLRGVIDAMAIVSGILARAVDLVNDNLNFLIDLFKILVAARLAIWIGSLLTGFIALARAVRTTGIVMAAFTRITTAKITALVLLGAVIARITGTYDSLVSWVQNLGETIYQALPESLREGIDGLGESIRGLGVDINEADEQAARHFREMNAAANLAADSIGNVGARARSVTPQVESMTESLRNAAQEINSGWQAVGNVIRASVEGGVEGAKKALRSLMLEMAQNNLMRALMMSLGGNSGVGLIMRGIGASMTAPNLGGVGALQMPAYAAGTNYHPGGLARVNEVGGEILNLPRGAQVIPHDISKDLARGGATKVEVNNYTGQEAREERTRGPNGEEVIRVIVGKQIAQGKHSKAMGSRYGLKDRTVAR